MAEEWSIEDYKNHLAGVSPRKARSRAQRPRFENIDEDSIGVMLKYSIPADRSVFIPGQVYSKKNSKQIWRKRPGKRATRWFYKGRRGMEPVVPFITDSQPVKAYKEHVAPYMIRERPKLNKLLFGKPKPVFVTLFFIMKTKGRWDFNNLSQLVADLLVRYGIIEDDDSRNVFFVPPLWEDQLPYAVNPESPGVIITVGKIF